MSQLTAYKSLIGLSGIVIILATITSITLLYKYSNDVIFWRMNYFYRWPIIGRMSIHKKNLYRDLQSGWYNGEKQLCTDFYPMYWKYAEKNEYYFEACRDYLAKAGETGRRLRPKWSWIVLSIFVFGEATIFGKLILSFAGELSNNQIQWVSYIIAFLLAALLLFLTERTGEELYKNTLIKKIIFWHANDQDPMHTIPRPNLQVRLDKNDIDNNDKDYQQILNRLNDVNAEVRPVYYYSIGTLILITIIASIAFIERSSLNVDIISETPGGAYATYAFYSLVFFAIQAMSVGIGYLYGFSSKQGEDAWKETYKYSTVDDYLRPYKRRANYYAYLAQNRLSHLQKYIRNQIQDESTDIKSEKTFLSYATEQVGNAK